MNYLNELLNKNFIIYDNLEGQWYLRDSWNGKYNDHSNMVCLISPHSGTNYKWLMRADYDETFDRWGVCLFEEYFNNETEFKEVLKHLSSFIKDRDKNISEELSDNVE